MRTMKRYRLSSAPAWLLLACILLLPVGCRRRSDDSATLDRVEEARLAAADPDNYGRAVRIRGVVTYCDPEWRLLFLQDQSGGLFIDLDQDVADLSAGRLIEVSGKLAPSNRGIESPHFRVLGPSPMPTPQLLLHPSDPSQVRLSEWVQIQGQVRAASMENQRLTLTVVDGADRTRVRILTPRQIPPINFVGADVQVTGVSAAALDEKKKTTDIQLFVSSLDQVNFRGTRKLADPFSGRPELLAMALDRRGVGKPLHLTGTVIEQKPGRLLVVGDGTSKVTARLADDSQLAPGDSVELLGFTSPSSAYEIEDTIVRMIAPRALASRINGAMRTLRQLKSLSVETAATQVPVDVRGTVTFIDPYSSLLFVQDKTAGAYVDIHRGSPVLETGDRVRVQGVSGPGDYAPIITHPVITRIGHGSMPKPQLLSLQMLASGINDGGWVQIAGTVHSVSQLHTQHWFKLVVAGHSYEMQLPHGANTDALQERLLDAQVSVGAVCGTKFNEKRQLVGLRFFVPNPGYVKILEPAPAEAAQSVRPLSTLLRFDPFNLSIHRARVRGIVTLVAGEQAFYMQDSSAAIYVVPEQPTQVRSGQVVDVSGFAALAPDGPFLEDAAVREVNRTARVVPVNLTAEDLTTGSYLSQLVTVKGRLLEHVSGPVEDTMILQDGYLLLQAQLPGAKISPAPRRGSLLEVTGILQSRGWPNQDSVRITLPGPGNVQVIQAASWWTPENTVRILAVALIVILAALLWMSFRAFRVRSYQARHDLLTGLPNRRAAMDCLERQMARARRERSSLGVILADVDHFKKINDTYGHQIGDAVLKRVAEIMSATIRPYDIVGRFGGEEFLIVISNCEVATANEISERIRIGVMEERFATTLHAQIFHVTCSFGVAMADVAPWDLDSTLAAADRALYAAKNSGRNRVFHAEIAPVDFASQSPLIS